MATKQSRQACVGVTGVRVEDRTTPSLARSSDGLSPWAADEAGSREPEAASMDRKLKLAPIVLLIDDEPAIVGAYARFLELVGLRVETCSSPTCALDRLSGGERFDAVICDVQMPELCGVELFQRARLVWPELEKRIIFVSGGLRAEDATFIRDNALRFFPKPLPAVAALEEAVREIVACVGRFRPETDA